jgi:peptidoglycan/LPS O-acetylase OafA/YrhL
MLLKFLKAKVVANCGCQTARVFPADHRLAYIDGVRAIAILAVVASHANIPGFRGGFVGVDVFFVISGFLITRQIVTQLVAGEFLAMDFYARRMLRILPPLLLVTVVSLFIATLFPLLPTEGRGLAKSAAATAAMISNYYFSSGTEYFAVKVEIIPLLHTWSLGVEEQYYLFAPAFMGLILSLAGRHNWDTTRALLRFGAIAVVVSYVILAILTQFDHRLAFYSIMSRSWQFALGGMLAVATLNGTPVQVHLRSALGLVGLAGIAAAVTLYDHHTSYPGFAAGLMPTLGTVLVLASGLDNDRAPLVRLLSSRPVVTIGLLSYSWYLWHWPLTELARTLAIGHSSLWKDIAASGIALLLSVPTYLLLERPLRSLRRPEITRAFGGRIVAGGLVGSAFVAIAALALARSQAFDHPLKAIDMGAPSRAIADCRTEAAMPQFTYITACVVGAPGNPSVVFMGDSHALMLAPLAGWSAQDSSSTAVVLGKTSCPPLQGVDVDYFVFRTCAMSNDEIIAWMQKHSSNPVTGAVLAGRWSNYNGEDSPDGEADLPRLLWSDPGRSGSSFDTLLYTGLETLIATIGPKRRVLLVGPVPELRRPAVHCLMRVQLNGEPPENCAMERAEVERRRHASMQVLQRVAAKFDNVRLIDPLDVFCDHDRCWPFGPKGVFYIDNDHLSSLGVEKLYQAFESDFRWVYGKPAK